MLGTVLTLYTHLLAFLILPTQILFAGYVWLSQWLTGKREGSDRFGHSPLVFFFLRFSLALVVILSCALPLLWPVLSPASISTSTSYDVRITARFGLQLPDYNSMLRLIGDLLVAYGAGTRVVVYLFFVLFLLGIFFTVYRQRRLAILIILWLTGPFFSTLFWQSKLAILPRYLIFLFPVYLIVVAKGIVLISDWFSRRWTDWRTRSHYFFEGHHPAVSQKWQSRQPIIGICLIPITVLFVLQLPIIRLNYLQGKQTDWRGLARYMEHHVQPGDVIVGEAWFQGAFMYYFNRLGDISIINVSAIDDAMPILTDLIEQRRRVWYVVIPGEFLRGPKAFDNSSMNFIRENFRPVDRREWEDPNFVFIFPQDSYFTFPIPEPLAKIYFRDDTTPAQIEFVEIRDARWTTENHRSISPGTMTRLYLQMSTSRPRLLKLTYFDFPDQDLQILVDDQVVGEITGGTSAAWKTYQAKVPPSAGDEVLVALVATETQPVGVSKIWLEYVPAEVKFEDMSTTDDSESYMNITPGTSYRGWLALDADHPRRVRLTYFDYPGRDMQLLIDGQLTGEITGGTGSDWKTYEALVPLSAGSVVSFTLTATGAEAASVNKICLEYISAETNFEDITGADWTTESHKDISPGVGYQGWLALEASAPRQLKLTYFDFPGKDLQVLVDGQVVGEIIGGTNATWKTYQARVPLSANDKVLVSLAAIGADNAGVSKIWLEYVPDEVN